MPKFPDAIRRITINGETYDHDNNPFTSREIEVPINVSKPRKYKVRQTPAAKAARERKILTMARIKPVTARELVEQFGYASPTGAIAVLHRLVSQGKLERVSNSHFALAQGQKDATPTMVNSIGNPYAPISTKEDMPEAYVKTMRLLQAYDGRITDQQFTQASGMAKGSKYYVLGRLRDNGWVERTEDNRNVPTAKWHENKEVPMYVVEKKEVDKLDTPQPAESLAVAAVDALYERYCNDLANFMAYVKKQR